MSAPVKPHPFDMFTQYSNRPTSSLWVFDPNENLAPARFAIRMKGALGIW